MGRESRRPRAPAAGAAEIPGPINGQPPAAQRWQPLDQQKLIGEPGADLHADADDNDPGRYPGKDQGAQAAIAGRRVEGHGGNQLLRIA